MKGRFITLEGAEGSGKSTQAALILEYLKSRGLPVLLLREPGGVRIAELIRDLLLDTRNEAMCAECEILLYMAARAQMVKEVLEPQLAGGTIVVCDRFLDSTLAYQGYGNGTNVDVIEQWGSFATQGIKPDLTLLFDIEPQKGLQRAGAHKDRIESRPLVYHQRVRAGYLDLSRRYPERIKVISVDAPKEIIFKKVQGLIDSLL